MGQQERKAQEGAIVRRLTFGAGAAALGLAGYFTVSSATAAPVVTGIQPAAGVQPAPAAAGPAEVGEKYFVRRVHVAAAQAPAGGVQAAGTARAPATVPQPVVQAPQQAAAPAPAPAPAAPAPVAAPAPAPKPVATTGGTPPK
jgi:pyruvate dehydrogenase E2 component (dihydrolipoamide acetyltransferase)